jgi:hypothetical protein
MQYGKDEKRIQILAEKPDESPFRRLRNIWDKAALGQVFSEHFGFPCPSFHQFLHHHNHPGLAQ